MPPGCSSSVTFAGAVPVLVRVNFVVAVAPIRTVLPMESAEAVSRPARSEKSALVTLFAVTFTLLVADEYARCAALKLCLPVAGTNIE